MSGWKWMWRSGIKRFLMWKDQKHPMDLNSQVQYNNLELHQRILENEFSVGTHLQQKADFWLRLNFPSSLAVGLTISLFLWFPAITEICHAGFFSQRIAAVQKYSAKVLAWKIHYKACLFSASKLKVSPDKTEWFSSIVDEIPPMTEWSAATRKEDLWSAPLQQPRHRFLGRVFSTAEDI